MNSKTKRWIALPLWMIGAYLLPQLLFGEALSANRLLYYTLLGAFIGSITILWSDAKARKITGKTDDEIYKVRQQRNLTLLISFEKAFEVCLQAVKNINPAKIKQVDVENGIIELRTRSKWDSLWGDIITIKLKRINESLTEADISSRPIPRTVLVSNGYAWKDVENISAYLRDKDAEINKNLLLDSTAILADVYVKPFQKERV